jgi:cellulose synthase operon protein C
VLDSDDGRILSALKSLMFPRAIVWRPAAAALLLLAGYAVVATEQPAWAAPIFGRLDDSSFEGVVQNVLRLSPADAAPAELHAAIDQFRAGKFDEALASLEAAVEKRPELPPARLMLARLFLAGGQIPQARLALEQVAAAQPDVPELYLIFGDLALAEGRLSDAALNFQRAATLVGQKNTPPRWQAQAGLAAIAEAREDWTAAETALSAWLTMEPKNGPARQRLGRALFHLARSKEALEAFQRAVQDDPSLEPAALTMGKLYYHAGNSEKAREWMEYAVKKEPDNPRAHLGVALWLLEIDEPQAAHARLDAAAKLDPNLPDLVRLRGLVARQLKDYAAAEAHFQLLLNESPGDFAAADQLALVLIEHPDESKRRRALELAEVNARQYSRSPEALATLGWIYYRLDRLDEAEQALQAAVSGGQTNSETAYYLARVRAARGETTAARQLVAAALEATGRFAHRAAARNWLQSLPDSPVDVGPPSR